MLNWALLAVALVIALPLLAFLWLLGYLMPGMRLLPDVFYPKGRRP